MFDRAELSIGDFNSFLVVRSVDLGVDPEAGFRGGGTYIVGGDVKSTQRCAPPVDGDVGKTFYARLDSICSSPAGSDRP
jgi:hypothetical protein